MLVRPSYRPHFQFVCSHRWSTPSHNTSTLSMSTSVTGSFPRGTRVTGPRSLPGGYPYPQDPGWPGEWYLLAGTGYPSPSQDWGIFSVYLFTAGGVPHLYAITLPLVPGPFPVTGSLPVGTSVTGPRSFPGRAC